MDKQTRNVNELFEWEHNPRNINADDFERLKRNLELLGQHSPLLITTDNIVLGGNMRLRAYKQLAPANHKFEQVWVTIIDFIQNNDGLWQAIIDGIPAPKVFKSKEDGMMEYSLSHNDRAGYYDADLLANAMPMFDVDWNVFSIDFGKPKNIQEFIEQPDPQLPNGSEEGEDAKKEVFVECPACGHSFNPKDINRVITEE